MTAASDIKAGGAYVDIYGNLGPLDKALSAAQARLRQFSQQVSAAGMKMLAGGGVLAAPFAIAARAGAAFSDEMSKVQAVTSATAADFDKLKQKAKDLGATTSFSATEVAQGMVFLGQSGQTTEEILLNIGGALNLARAGTLELGRATEIAVGVQNAFQIAAKDSARVVDVLAKTQASSAVNIEEMGQAMKFVAPLANSLGQSLEDTSVALGLLGNRFLKGSIAGTGLGIIFRKLSETDIQKKLKELGVEALDAAGNIRPVARVIKELGDKTKSMTKAGRASLFSQLFDARGQKAALALAGATTEEIANLEQQIKTSAGAGAEMAKVMDNNLGGAWRRLVSVLESLQIAIEEALDNTLRKGLDNAAKWIATAKDWVQNNQQLIVGLAKIAKTLLLVGGSLLAIGKLAAVFAMLSSPITIVVTALLLVADALGLIDTGVMDVVKSFKIGGASIATWFSAGLIEILKIWETVKNALANGWGVIQVAAGDAGQAIYFGMLKGLEAISKGFWWMVEQAAKAMSSLVTTVRRKWLEVEHAVGLIDVNEFSKKWHEAESGIGGAAIEFAKAQGKKAGAFWAAEEEAVVNSHAKTWAEFEKERVARSEESAKKIAQLNKDSVNLFLQDMQETKKDGKSASEAIKKKLQDALGEFAKPDAKLSGIQTQARAEIVGQFGAAGFFERFAGMFSQKTDEKILSENAKQTGLLSSINDKISNVGIAKFS